MTAPHVHGRLHRACQHPDCKTARAKYAKKWKLDHERGIPRTIDPTPARLHVAHLLGQGWTCRGIAGAAGLAPQTVTRLARGEARKIGRTTAAKILAIDTGTLPAQASVQTTEPFVPRIGTVRRLQALMYMGYSHPDLKARGLDSSNILNQTGTWVTRSTHDRVAAVYRELAHKEGPHPRSRYEAMKRGYVGPTAWDDIDHDLEPENEDDEVAS